MTKININDAWAYATSFFSDQHANHAIILIGVGIVGPLLLNILLGGAAGGAAMDPAALATGAASMAAFSGTVILLGFISFAVQTGSYFASWRMGLAPGEESIGSAIGYGVVAALPVLLVSLAFVLVLGIVLGVVFGASIVPLIMSGGTPTNAQAAGAGISMLVGLPFFLVFVLWLAARFCCMGPVMADQRTYNPITGLTGSWRMTGASQWKLMGYFVLIFIVFLIISAIVGMVAGVSMMAGAQPGGAGFGLTMILGSVIGIPLAYFYVAVPAGIYRALGGGAAADVFA